MTTPEIKSISIVAKFSDGVCRQVVIKKDTQSVVLSAIVACEGSIRVFENPIEGIELVTMEKEM